MATQDTQDTQDTQNTKEETVDAPEEKQDTLTELKKTLSNLEDWKKTWNNVTATVRKSIKEWEKLQKDMTKIQNKKFKRKNTSERADGTVERKEPSGITKPCPISTELAEFLEVPHDTLLARTETTKLITTYVKENDLQNPENKRQFLLTKCDAGKKLATLLGTTDLSYFNLQTYLKHHFPKKDVPATPVPVNDAPKEVIQDDEKKDAPKKKIIKRIVKKVKRVDSPLMEEAVTVA